MLITKSGIRFIAIISVLTLIFLTFSACGGTYKENSSFAMGSLITSKVYTDDEETAAEVFELINESAAKADKALSNTDEEAEIYKLNKDGKVFASDYLESVLMDTIMLCNILERKVDISLGNITKLWGFNTETPSLPDKEEIEKQLKNIDIEKIKIDEALGKITIPEDISLDMGAFGKGAACDLIFDKTESFGTPLLVSFGGTIFAYGKGPSDGKWKIAVRDPLGDASSYFATLNLSPLDPKYAVFVSTSGSYEKTFTENSVSYHHIIDPETGYPADNDLVSVTVVANSGLNADALSTACFVNGYNEETLMFLESFSAEAVFVFKDKTYSYTDGIEDCFKINNKEYVKR